MELLNFRTASLFTVVGSLLFASGLTAFADSFEFDESELYGDDIAEGIEVSDPLEPINRVTFKFNDVVYTYVMEPIADTYQFIAPDPVQKGASNFFDNLKYPVRLAGNLLQGRFKGAWVETGRFAINTTVGVVGVFRPADSVEGYAPIPSEDIGQAFGAWGVGAGPYLVLPILGPSNLRDLGGFVGDRAVHPLQEPFSAIDSWNWEWQLALAGSEVIVNSPSLIERYNQLKGGAIDPYSSMKNGYSQFRRAAIEE